MGRMLEALRQSEPHPALEVRPVLHAEAPAQEPEAEIEGEIPYIEVGPQRSMEASPSVLACTPPSLLRAPAQAPAEAPAQEPAAARIAFHPAASPRPVRPSSIVPELVAFHVPENPASIQYRELLPALLNACGDGSRERSRALLFSAAQPKAGTTTVLLNVAITAARQGRRRVLVVDASSPQPAIAGRLGLSAVPGLREVLAGSTNLEGALQATEQAGLFALTAGIASSSGTRFVAETTQSLLRQVRQRFDLVLVDGPAWDARPESRSLAQGCDAVCLVLPETAVDRPETDRLLQAIQEQGARLAGFIVSSHPGT